jgi:hypothetical protein
MPSGPRHVRVAAAYRCLRQITCRFGGLSPDYVRFTLESGHSPRIRCRIQKFLKAALYACHQSVLPIN